jgi:hypothetical protein
MPLTELQAGLGLRLAKPNGLIGRNLAFGRNKLIKLIMAFGHNKLITACGYKELIVLTNVSPSNKLTVKYSEIRCSIQSHQPQQRNQTMPYPLAAYQTNPTTPSCASTFQLVVTLIWIVSPEGVQAPSNIQVYCCINFVVSIIIRNF